MDKLFEEKFLEKYFHEKGTLITQTENGMSFESVEDKKSIELSFTNVDGLVFVNCAIEDDLLDGNISIVAKEDIEKLIKLGYKI